MNCNMKIRELKKWNISVWIDNSEISKIADTGTVITLLFVDFLMLRNFILYAFFFVIYIQCSIKKTYSTNRHKKQHRIAQLPTSEYFSENSFNNSLQFIYQLSYVLTLPLCSAKRNNWLNKKRITEAKVLLVSRCSGVLKSTTNNLKTKLNPWKRVFMEITFDKVTTSF